MAKKNHVSHQHIVRIKSLDTARRIVFGEVYAPDRLDTYGEYMKAADIETMAHRFMTLPKLSEVVDTNHDNQPNGSYPIESFIARSGDPQFTEGAWVLGVKVPDDATWNAITAGRINAFSFEAMVIPQETEIEYFVIRDHVGAVEAAMEHDHAYMVQVDSKGMVVKGWTSPAPDGHTHQITRASITEVTGDHSHRYFL